MTSCFPVFVLLQERAQLFHLEIQQQKEAYYETDQQQHMFELGPNRFVTIRRDQLLWDAFDTLNKLGEALKGRVRIQYVSEAGVPEAGIDGGGLFKELMEELLKQGFDPSVSIWGESVGNCESVTMGSERRRGKGKVVMACWGKQERPWGQWERGLRGSKAVGPGGGCGAPGVGAGQGGGTWRRGRRLHGQSGLGSCAWLVHRLFMELVEELLSQGV